MRLHFAEIVWGQNEFDSSGIGQRKFAVSMNGKPLLPDFDIVRDSGSATVASEKYFRDVSPATDGLLRLAFKSNMECLLNAIEITPGIAGRMRPVRILGGPRIYSDREGQLWGPDRYFLGGRFIRHWNVIKGRQDPDLYTSERWGRFEYVIPVATGTYTVSLLFSESNFGPGNIGGGGTGSRVFDVYCNGAVLLKSFDIFAEADGENRAVEKTFRGIRPNAVDKIQLSFIPRQDYACVNAIEVTEEAASR